MLFNSHNFIFIFLPSVLILYFLFHKNYKYRLTLLTLASFYFYAYWDLKYSVLLIISILLNYALSFFVKRKNKIAFFLAILINLLILATFKYLGMFINFLQLFSERDIIKIDLILPLGISFFTFQQIVFQIDNFNNKITTPKLSEYFFFITFFPQIIAGPIVHHQEIFSQIKKKIKLSENFLIGFSIFSIGLFKKVIIADYVAVSSDAYYGAIASGYYPSLLESLIGTLSFTIQIYFDFSAYSDMAMGLAYIFGFKLPLNFASPYQATSISEFWRRWHITLSRFFKNYLYIPLGGNSDHILKSFFNLFIVMSLAGLWHGASINFIFWGMIHGFFLIVNHAYRKIKEKISILKISPMFSWLITFFCINLSWVPFRTSNFNETIVVWKSIFSIDNFILPSSISMLGLPTKEFIQIVDYYNVSIVILISLIIVFFLPNIYQVFSTYNVALKSKGYFSDSYSKLNFRWKPNYLWLFLLILSVFFSLGKLSEQKEFLYFQF